MSAAYPRPARRTILLLDAALVLWAVAWILAGTMVAREAGGIAKLGDTVVVAGGAIEQTGDLLGTLGALPFVGGRVGELAERIEQAGASAQADARASRDSVDRLSRLLGVTVALVAILPLLALYLPLRLGWRRESLALRAALERAPSDPRVEEFLARRAVHTLAYDRLREVSADPWRDLQERRFSALAAAELERLGLRPPGQGP